MNRIPLLYSLHSGGLYGTERMALATAECLAAEFLPVIVAPNGPALAEAARLGFETLAFETPAKYAADVRRWFAGHRQLAAIGTRVLHTAVMFGWNGVYRRRLANIQVIHGGADERLSYRRKQWLRYTGARQVAVSEFVRQRLAANGTPAESVTVVENFLSRSRIDLACRRQPFRDRGVRHVLIVSRLDPIKRVDLLLEALDLAPDLRGLRFRILGTGEDEQRLKMRAAGAYPNVEFLGFTPDVDRHMAASDLLLHLCPEEPFGLVVLEALAAGLPVLTPDRGGAGAIVKHGRSGFHFRANDAWALAERLRELAQAPAASLNAVAAEGSRLLRTRYSADAGALQYRNLIEDCLA